MTGGGHPLIPLRSSLDDPQLLGNVLSSDSWRAWRILLIAAMGEPLDNAERAIFYRLTDRQSEPVEAGSPAQRPRWPSIWPPWSTMPACWRSASRRLT